MKYNCFYELENIFLSKLVLNSKVVHLMEGLVGGEQTERAAF